MKSNVLGLRTTIYKVGDINQAKEWYAKVFEVQPYFDEPFYVGFDIGGYELGLQPEATPSKDKDESVVSYWGVDDIHGEYRRFVSLGALEYEAPREVGGDIVVAKVKDHWGNIIGLIYNPHFKGGL
jgi:predicted enzyme related to lactoylglutathione lyase